jgi:hypothetical protein
MHTSISIGKTHIHFKIRYKKHISEIKLKKTAPNSNFAKHVLENNYNIYFNSDLEELHTHNEKKN